MAARIEAAVKDYERQKKDVIEAGKALEFAERECEQAKRKLERIEAQGKALSLKTDNLEKKRNALHDQFMSMEAKTREAVFDEARAKLLEGEECPVCGSRSHPRTSHENSGSENPDNLFMIKTRLNEECRRADEAFRDSEKKLRDERDNWSKARAEENSAHKEQARCIDELSTRKVKLNECRIALTGELHRAGIAWNDNTREIIERVREWSRRIDSLEKQIQTSQQKVRTLQAVIMSDSESLDAKRKELLALTAELEGLEVLFTESLAKNGFPDEIAFSVAAGREVKEIEAMRMKRDELSSQHERLQGALSNFQKELDAKKAMNLTDKTRNEIESQYQQEDAILKELHQKKGQLNQNLITASTLTERIRALESEYNVQKVAAENWKDFCSLIGSAKGDKYNIFAQKITLGLVVNNANDYLKKMNGRYSLLLTPDNDNLEISVRDSQQSGEIRPTSNLSGGERFIISLALALGLSQISGGKAPVDSLFIDEGFGSLDDEALNSALDALGEIHRDGRMIGIVSHITGISERVLTKIIVIRKTEGTSILEGPGCSGGR